MKKLTVLLLALALLAGIFVACESGESEVTTEGAAELGELVDYVATLKFNPNSGRAYTETTVKTFVDGDTTHFNVPSSIVSGGVLKARYLGINTPESTGQIEPWGKKASNYTKAALSAATSIIVESDTVSWNPDSTGDRYLVWVWYKTAEMTDYRCLNLEILQAGLAVSSSSAELSYADLCVSILNQSVTHKLYVFSKEKDPDFYYGAAMPITLKELKTNIESYKDKTVGFEGVVVRNSGNTAYVEEYDEETGLYFGIQVYYGFNLDYFGQEILTVGNRILVVGSVQYYETGGTYQISDIKYNAMRPDDESNIKLISKGHEGAYTEVGAKELLSEKVTLNITVVEGENESIVEKTFDRGFLTMHGSASLKGLTIKSVYTTQNEDSSNFGALTLTCEAEDGTEIVLRTIVLKDSAGKTITADAFPAGSKVNARGVVDVYNGEYQLKVFSANDITFIN
ncbi:MAG: thermonuclease family protein [Clostridia bacterium]|nr:thermonuclease family protein [Clostridia bacterium]